MLKDMSTLNCYSPMVFVFRSPPESSPHFINSGLNTYGEDDMLNPIFSFCVYQVEMIISYIFYGAVFETRFTPAKRLLIGGLLFSLGSGINLLLRNNATMNILSTFALTALYGSSCFDSTVLKSLFYSAIMGIINAAVEVAVVSLSSYVTGTAFGEYNSNFTLALFQAVLIKTFYFLIILI